MDGPGFYTTPWDVNGELTRSDMEETLRSHGLEQWIDRFRALAPVGDTPTALILQVRDGRWDLYGEPQGGQRGEIDYDARYTIDSDTITAAHEGDSNTYRWALEWIRGADSARLRW